MSKIFLTTFEPWKERKTNISSEVLKNIKKKNIPDLDSLVFPVTFDDFRTELEYIKNFNPDYVLCLGEEKGLVEFEKSDPPELERIATNLIKCDGLSDNKGRIIENQPIIENAPPLYLTTLPYDEIIEHVRKHGFRMKECDDAGTYVCNFIFYKLLHEFNDSKTKVGFLHFPHLGDIEEFTDLTCLIIDYLKEYSGGKGKWEKF